MVYGRNKFSKWEILPLIEPTCSVGLFLEIVFYKMFQAKLD